MEEQSKKYYSGKQEKMVADALGGYVVGGSGARPTNPGDVKTYEWLVECKTHTTPDHTIFFDSDVWKKICNEAMATHRKPVLVVDDGSQKLKKTWCLCFAKNLNGGNMIVVDFPNAIRKNISCKHEKLAETLKQASKRYIGEFYESAAYEVRWMEEDVCILPLELFKEILDK